MHSRFIALYALLVPVALPLVAQERVPHRNRASGNGEDIRPLDLIGNRRARLGLVVDMRANESDSLGATIQSVTPGGPAAKAGLHSGDIITKLNGKSLVRSTTSEADEAQSLAGLKLIELAAKLGPNDTITVEYRRGSDLKTTSLVTGNERILGLWDRRFSIEAPDRPFRTEGDEMPMRRMRIDRGPGGDMFLAFGGPFAALELAPLNSSLGSYFGTTEGVLVIDAPEKSTLGLKGGDVVMSVDGRRASGPASLLRILRSYDPGDVIKLDIMRNKSRVTISAKIDNEKEE